ncbi:MULTISPECIES: hypothetical protein [unclassified Microcoleus]|uniref:hypothetical protein n=1 Tax=unclassified Microcoleus TaxID=2642155 RepID=UPI001D361C55|nr:MULTISPECIES: hypothetical protein [unclassified Microcoleus]MCC3512655.1 hypothetical protein [Microcoleus sp. PH2017_17_BER_D_A]TAE15245.1 MAG: hypothetical protein EAZ94_05095 [Oscillatoriales cyanobacterium]MCC3410730.1 hypothetical protein [Microcoleus sp. PH2017_02_FOX_O_A]MCC3434578.1 hypothetical protein [Microcoleus sp. PH2017_05_CCC_O_A]MCC3492100.1 hypothetical protein [Microcoleus sp. PH2017_16_JOR_D_A]
MLSKSSRLIYGDELITATELNQQLNRVLDLAMEHPVTITRNDQHFALLRREEMTLWVKAATLSLTVFEVSAAAYRLRLGEAISSANPYHWLTVFDSDELCELIAELEKAYRLAESESGAWNQIEIVIHEWHESAKAISSPELAAAFSDEIDEVLLTPPQIESTTESTQL